jgi:hypothetical protein
MDTQEAPKKMKRYLQLSHINDVNEFTDLGYHLHSFQVNHIAYPDGSSERYETFIMVLGKPDYHDVTNLADVKPMDVDTYLARGWEIASTSISTKFVRMIKRRID